MFTPRDVVGTHFLRVHNGVKTLSPPANSFGGLSLDIRCGSGIGNEKGLRTWNILCTPFVRLEARC